MRMMWDVLMWCCGDGDVCVCVVCVEWYGIEWDGGEECENDVDDDVDGCEWGRGDVREGKVKLCEGGARARDGEATRIARRVRARGV